MTLRALICLPIYNNDHTVERVVLSLLRETGLSILIVDDGSDHPLILNQTASLAALNAGRIHVVRHEKNRGKGRALQTAFAWAIKHDFTHIHTIDGDGQHLATESTRMLASALENPWDLIIGRRKFSGLNVPNVSRFGRLFSNFWVGFQTGSHVHDSQSGFRVYPLFHVQNMRFWTKRFDFEIEVLIRLLWSGVHVTEVETDVFYPPEHERVSHFNKFTDNVRISILNTILVALSLILKNRQPKRSALAVGTGVFIGCSPFYGFHTILVAIASFGLRLNAILMLLGSQISLPPAAIFLIPFEIAVGNKILAKFGKSEHATTIAHSSLAGLLKTAADHSRAWFVGSIATGLALGLISGLITWFFTRRVETRSKSANWNGRTRGGRLGNGILKLMIRTFGLRFGYGCLVFVVPYFYLFAPKARAAADEYWRIQRPQSGWLARRILTMKQMFRFGQVLMDRGFQSFSTVPRFTINSHGMEMIAAAAAKRQRLMLLSGHIGSWDLAASFLPHDGMLGRFNMVHYQSEGLTFEKVVGNGKSNEHVTSVVTGDAPTMLIKQSLERGEPVGLMADRATASQYELVSFLGRLAPFDTRPFRIAASLESSMVFAYGVKGKGNGYSLYAFPAKPHRYKTNRPRHLQVHEWLEEYAKSLEQMLKIYPEQWFNFFPFFSSVPKSPPGVPLSKEQHHLLEEWHTPTKPEPE